MPFLFTSYQLCVLVVLIVCKFLSTVIWSLQAPFYPGEAEKKNATPLESGIVLGSYEIMMFLMCPFIANKLPKIGAYKAFHIGFVLCAVSTILFGLLDKVNDRLLFIGLSLVLRLLEAIGGSSVFLATFMMANRLFPASIATICGIIETTFAIGMASGPPLGGLLFEFGDKYGFGFTTPFATVGVLMLCMTIVTCTILPKDQVFPTESAEGIVQTANETSASPSFGFFVLLRIPKVLLYASCAMGAAICVGFLTSTLGLHLKNFDLSPLQTGMIFLIYGGVYAVTGFLWGLLCDRINHPEYITLLGMILALISFTFIGPLPAIPLTSSVHLTSVSLAVFGLGLGGLYVSVYALILREAKKNGFPEDSKTSAIVAGLWMEGISLGAFIGPLIGGFLLNYTKFPEASLSVIAILSALSLALAVSIFGSNCNLKMKAESHNKVKAGHPIDLLPLPA